MFEGDMEGMATAAVQDAAPCGCFVGVVLAALAAVASAAIIYAAAVGL